MIWRVLLAASISSLTFASQYEKQCSGMEDIKPCYCSVYRDDINIRCKPKYLNDLRKAFVKLRGSKKLHIEIYGAYTKDTSIPSDLFKGLDVIKIDFIYPHSIARFGDEGRSSFEGLENTLKDLKIGHTRRIKIGDILDYMPLEYLNITSFNVLQKLHVAMYNVSKLGKDFFPKGSIGLTDLEIRSYNVREIEDKVFEKFVNLKRLYVITRTFSEFRRSMFPSPATFLEHLDLSFNKISSLPEDMFVDMPSLRTVNLEGNPLKRLSEATWSAVWSQLDYLDVGIADVYGYEDGNLLKCDKHILWMYEVRRPKNLIGECYHQSIGFGRIELKEMIDKKIWVHRE